MSGSETPTGARPRTSTGRTTARLAPPPHLVREGTSTKIIREELVRFGPEGRLFGILSRPDEGTSRSTAVLLLNAGAVTHTGPNRLYVLQARAWAAAGYFVLRMDTGGLGDSAPAAGWTEGDPYAPDALRDAAAGVAFLEALPQEEGRAEAKRIVASGLCSGAYLSFHLARTQKVTGALLVNPQTFYWKHGMSLDVSSSRTFNQTQHYRGALMRVETWKKLARGKVDLRLLARTVQARVSHVAAARTQRALARWLPSREENLRKDLRSILERGTDLAMFFSAGDPGLDLMDLHLGKRELSRLEKRGLRIEIFEGSDHTFTPVWTQPLLCKRMTEMLEERFP